MGVSGVEEVSWNICFLPLVIVMSMVMARCSGGAFEMVGWLDIRNVGIWHDRNTLKLC